jgi:hypothetical protein
MMRIMIELPPSLARSAIGLVEDGGFESMDSLVAEALSFFLAARAGNALSPFTDSCGRLLGPPEADGPKASNVVSSERPTWVWGMVNRVFPLKIVARVAANLCGGTGGVLSRIQTRTANCAAAVAAVLSADDEAHKRKRNDCRAVGLPLGPDLQRSQVRFAHHYVGRRSAAGGLSGGAFEIGILGLAAYDPLKVAPTALGWEFARLSNPVLDGWESRDFGSINLSQEEKEFYVLEIARKIPAEREAFAQVLTAISESPESPQAVADRVRPVVAAGSSENVVITTRSGLLGRMTDVGAVTREPQGRSAIYRITGLGQQFLDSLKRGQS